MALVRLGPMAAARAMARTREGKERITSMIRMMMLSVRPLK